MSKKLRFLAVLLCAAMCATLVAGIGTARATTDSAPATLSICVPQIPGVEDMATNTFTQWIQQQTNVTVNWTYIPANQSSEKMTAIMNSGSLPDVFMTCVWGGGLNSASVAMYADQGLFIPLESYFTAEKMPNMMQAIDTCGIPNVQGVLTYNDGHIYSFPQLDTCQHCEYASKMWVYQPFLDTLGMQAPTTTDEFTAMLQAFKDKNPNGDTANPVIPMTGCDDRQGGWHDNIFDFLMNSFVYYDSGSTGAGQGFYVKDGKVENCLTDPQYKAGLAYIKSLWDAGLIDHSAMTQPNADLVKQVENPAGPSVGAVPGGWVGMFAQFGGDRAKHYVPIAPLKGPAGVQISPRYPSYPNNNEYVITSSCKDVDAACRFADIMYTQEATLDIRAGGLKDVNWKLAEPGDKDFDGNQAVWTPLIPWNDSTPQNASWLELGVWNYTSLRASQTVPPDIDYYGSQGLEYLLYHETMTKYVPYGVNMNLPPLTFSPDDGMTVGQAKTDLDTLFTTSQFNFISGKDDLDTGWDSYVQQVQAQLDILTPIYQASYDKAYSSGVGILK